MLLEKVEHIDIPDGLDFRVLVVDNRSTDNTRQIVRECIRRNPLLFGYVYEANHGLSHARNRALRETDTDVVAFLDDDAIPRNGWLEALLEGYSLGDEVGVVGGQALLAFNNKSRPRWFTKPLYKYMSEREVLSGGIVNCTQPTDHPFGANISFRRSVAISLGGFKTDLGRVGSMLLSGEETELCERAMNSGYRILLHSGAIVDHYIAPERITLRCLARQAWADGKCSFAWQDVGRMPLSGPQVGIEFATCFYRFGKRFVQKPIGIPYLIINIYDLISEFSSVCKRFSISERSR
jgi:glycosyltransferase involved in cell wall biosynthesis